jgi:transposase
LAFLSGKEAAMRGKKDRQPNMFYALDVEDRIRPDHPLRAIKKLVDEDLSRMGHLFNKAYSDTGRPSIPPERLLKAMLLKALYSIRSESQLVERIDTDLLFRWFLDMDPATDAFDQTAFTHNRKRLDDHGITAAFFGQTVKRALADHASHDHFSVDGTLIESYASIKSFVPKDLADKKDSDDSNGFKSRNAEVDFHGQKRSNDTHVSKTDPDARLYRKSAGQEAKLAHLGHVLTDNRQGLVLAADISRADGQAERSTALAMLDQLKADHGITPKTLGADKGYDAGPFMMEVEARKIVPHVAMREGRVGGENPEKRRDQEAIAARRRMAGRLKRLGYKLSQKTRKRAEEAIGWIKTLAGMTRATLAGQWKIRQQFQIAAAGYNYVRLARLNAAA